MKERLIELRKVLGLNVTKFAESVEVSKALISLYESGDRIPSARTIRDICRVHNVNKNWLLTGEGEMFAEPTREEEIADLATSLFEGELSKTAEDLIKVICKLDEKGLEMLLNAANGLLEVSKISNVIEEAKKNKNGLD